MNKFMLTLGEGNFQVLQSEAKGRGISIQELIRAVIVPNWVRENLDSAINGPSTLQRSQPTDPGMRYNALLRSQTTDRTRGRT